jgi:hypothetical protein
MVCHADHLDCEAPMTNVAEKLKCVERELGMRKRVYPGLVRRGKMSVTESDYEIKTMESIADDYRELAAQQGLPIFDE